MREDLRIGYRYSAKEFVVDFDIQTRILTVSDFLNGHYHKIFVVKVLDDVDLSKVHLYFDLYKGCDKKLKIDDVEFETHNQTLVSNKYNSIVKAKSEGYYCGLLDTPLIPFKKYKFKCFKWDDTDIVGLGIFRRDKISSSHYRFDWANGYQEHCGMIAVSCNRNCMHDSQSMKIDDNMTSDFSIGSGDFLAVEYDSVEQRVNFHNLTNNKQSTFWYPTDIVKIDDYYVEGFLGNGYGNISIF